MRAFQNAEKEVAAGNLWRAREILRGSVPNAAYNSDLFEQLGSVCLLMGDLPEAGRFLFLSGRAKPEYETAIRIFLRRNGRNWRTLWQTFPKQAKLERLSDYPDAMERRLRDCGFPEVLPNKVISNSRDPETTQDVIVWLIVIAVLALLVLGIIKVIEIVKWIF